MAIIDYASNGNLRGCLTKIVKSDWKQKLHMLYTIIAGLDEIHQQNLIHCDFHDGNILVHSNAEVCISDLGLCRPAKSSFKKDDIYGVIPFMAPEVLRGKTYTPASDIYSFSMIMWEFTSGISPFNDRAHDFQLSLSICKGERPKIIENTPQCYVDLMKKCWDENPLKRPSASEVLSIIGNWVNPGHNIKDVSEDFKNNIMEFIEANKNLTISKAISNKPITKSHPQAYYTSRMLDFTAKLNEVLDQKDMENYNYNNNQNNELFETEISGNYFNIF